MFNIGVNNSSAFICLTRIALSGYLSIGIRVQKADQNRLSSGNLFSMLRGLINPRVVYTPPWRISYKPGGTLKLYL